jgi:vacuolar-type H+-ATPase subunit D/Vma8
MSLEFVGEAWKKAKEYVELLTLKMNALWQQFYALTDMQTKDSIQREISDTYEKLLKAQEEETRLRQAYEEQFNQKKSAEAPPIWIR